MNIESPYFEFKPELGVALMSLCKFCDCKNINYSVNFDRLVSENANIEKAILEVLKSYGVSGKNDMYNRISFRKKYVYENDYPEQICLPQTSYLIKKLPI